MSVAERAKEFVAARKSLVLATVSGHGDPTASHAPFVRADGNLYVYTSAMSRHTGDMKEFSKVSAMIIEDEASVTNIFARKRVTFSCFTEAVSKESSECREVLNLFSQTFGAIFEPMKSLGDFTLFRLDPFEVKYVEGFGRAFLLDRNLDLVERITGPKPVPHK